MSPSSTSNIFPSFNGDGLKAYIQSVVYKTMVVQPAPDQERRLYENLPPVVTEIYTPSAEDRECYPAIWTDSPQGFLHGWRSNNERSSVLRQFPKKTSALYDAPALSPVLFCALPLSGPMIASLPRSNRTWPYLNRPIDAILHQIGATVYLPVECEELAANVACLMRDRMAKGANLNQ
ncbi:hypothetical protein BGZ98_001857 [Dissophora globulifera]|nr:hypothetical protein BGZ98_001857 [Dissophora globulifera]